MVWGDSYVAGGWASPVPAARSIAVVVALALPWTLSRLDRDAALGSGPLATVIQDLLPIVSYLG